MRENEMKKILEVRLRAMSLSWVNLVANMEQAESAEKRARMQQEAAAIKQQMAEYTKQLEAM